MITGKFVSNEGANLCQQILAEFFTGVGKVRLFKNNVVVDCSKVIGDFTQCDFSGYAQLAPIWLDSGAADAPCHAQAGFNPANAVFTHNGGGVGNTVYGWYIMETGGGGLVAAGNFAAPVDMSLLNDKITLTFTFEVESKY
jgi:hypothetical protein